MRSPRRTSHLRTAVDTNRLFRSPTVWSKSHRARLIRLCRGDVPPGPCAPSRNRHEKGLGLSPDPTTVHPLPAHDRVVFRNPLVTSPNITVGDYMYYDDPDGATDFEHRNVRYASGWNASASASTARSPREPRS